MTFTGSWQNIFFLIVSHFLMKDNVEHKINKNKII